MAKRRCPFSDCRPQLKTHVSERELSDGVLGDKMKKVVYERTMNLLYQGARVTPPSEVLTEVHHDIKKMNKQCDSIIPQDSLKQMTLSSQCQLQSSSLKTEGGPVAITQCSGCSTVMLQDMLSCTFCEKTLCANCIVICKRCQEGFCSACTFNMYDLRESHVCRNCC